MTTFNTGAYPSGCTQRDVDMAAPGYWDDPYYFEPKCVHCDDAGCDRCCETNPVTLDDLDLIAEDIALTESAAALKTRFTDLHETTMAILTGE